MDAAHARGSDEARGGRSGADRRIRSAIRQRARSCALGFVFVRWSVRVMVLV